MVLVLGIRGRARYAQAHAPKRRGHHRVLRVLHGWLLQHKELVGFLGSAVDYLRKATIEGPVAPQADITMGVKIVLFPVDSAMIALVLLTRSQLRVDPIQPSSRAASQRSVGTDYDDRYL